MTADEIEELFSELDGRQRHDDALVVYATIKADRHNERQRAYVDAHRKKMREVWKKNAKAYRARKKAQKETRE